jgi:hypothetical protein
MKLYGKLVRPGAYPSEVIGVEAFGAVKHLVHGCFLTVTDASTTPASVDAEIEKGILYALPDSYKLLIGDPSFAGWRRAGALYAGRNHSDDVVTVSLSAYALSEEWWITDYAVYNRHSRTFSASSIRQWSSEVAAEKWLANTNEVHNLVLVSEGLANLVVDPRTAIDEWFAHSEDKKRAAAVAALAAADAEQARKVREILGRAPGDLSIEEFAARMRMRRSRGTT